MNNNNKDNLSPSPTDELALIRTKLANERTFLAYLRTFIGVFASGVGLIKLTDDSLFIGCGFVLIAIAPFILIFGTIRLIMVKRSLRWKKIYEDGDRT